MQFDQSFFATGIQKLAGVDEVGRGPLAGPVVAAICTLPARASFKHLNDSKRLSASMREHLALEIQNYPGASWALGWVSAFDVDQFNAHAASLIAMCLALSKLPEKPDYLLIDGKFYLHHQKQVVPKISRDRCRPIVRGDQFSQVIAAASVLAKVARDRYMRDQNRHWPEYGFDRHKGYATREHVRALNKFGISPLHRRSFGPVQRAEIKRKSQDVSQPDARTARCALISSVEL